MLDSPMDTTQQKYGRLTIEVFPEAARKSFSINLQKLGKGIRYKGLALSVPLGIQIARRLGLTNLFIFGESRLTSTVTRKVTVPSRDSRD
jgi:hypothetical protein